MADRVLRIPALVLLAAVIATGCQFLPSGPPTVTCVDVEQAVCDRTVARLIEEARRMQPPKGIVSITITGGDRGQVVYDDGTAMSWMP